MWNLYTSIGLKVVILLCRIRNLLTDKFRDYGGQIEANLPPDDQIPANGYTPAQRHANALDLVNFFQMVFNQRESKLDKEQESEEPNTVDQDFIVHSGKTPVKDQKKKRKKKWVSYFAFKDFFCTWVVSKNCDVSQTWKKHE